MIKSPTKEGTRKAAKVAPKVSAKPSIASWEDDSLIKSCGSTAVSSLDNLLDLTAGVKLFIESE